MTRLDVIASDRPATATWTARAACHGVDPGLFYPSGYKGHHALAQIARAKAVCATCPVMDPCRAEADGEGIWAGTTPRERAAAASDAPSLWDLPG